MNSHLNVFHAYTKEYRTYQLENDLTRALAICLQEDRILLHELLKEILHRQPAGKDLYQQLFSNRPAVDEKGHTDRIDIDIQQRVSNLTDASTLVAVSLSACPMDIPKFFDPKEATDNDPITDMVIRINDIAIIFEVKPHWEDCSHQLFTQASNWFNGNEDKKDDDIKNHVYPVDLNWKKLMELVLKISHFQAYAGYPSRTVRDFIELIKSHNPDWLPTSAFAFLEFREDRRPLHNRLDLALSQAETTKLDASDRMGFSVDFKWASEILFSFPWEEDGSKYLRATVWPGNTKGQGWHLYTSDGAPRFKNEVSLNGKAYAVQKAFHLKFSHFQKYFTSLDGLESDFRESLLTRDKFIHISGRQKRGDHHWDYLQQIFDEHFKPEYDWRDKCKFQEKLVKSGKSYFDLSFGYSLWVDILYEDLQQIDRENEDFEPLILLLEEITKEFSNIVMD